MPQEPRPWGPFRALLPRQQLCGALGCTGGGFPGWAEPSRGTWGGLRALGGVLGYLGGVSGQWGEPGRSQPPSAARTGDVGHPLGSVLGCPRRVLGQGGPPLCHPVPRHARAALVPSRSQEMLADAFPSHQPSFPQTHPFSPHRGSFLRHKHHLAPQEGPQGATTLRAPLIPPGGGRFFSTIPYKHEGMGLRLHVPPPAMGSLLGEAETRFCPPKLWGAGGGCCSKQGITSPLPARLVIGWGRGHQLGTLETEGLSWPEPWGRETGFLFLPAFSMCLYRFGLLKAVWGLRDEGLWGVNLEGAGIGAPHIPPGSQGCSHLCSSELYQSIKLPSQPCHHSAPELTPSPMQPASTWSCLQGRDSLPPVPPSLGTLPTPKSSL